MVRRRRRRDGVCSVKSTLFNNYAHSRWRTLVLYYLRTRLSRSVVVVRRRVWVVAEPGKSGWGVTRSRRCVAFRALSRRRATNEFRLRERLSGFGAFGFFLLLERRVFETGERFG